MRILITRPREDAAALADKLKARGHDVIVEPLLEIRFATGVTVDLTGVQAIVFTSANGVRAFAAAETRRDLPAYCVGDTTASQARAAGFTQVESAGGNVDDLARLVRERLKPGDGTLLHAAAANVAGDLAGVLGRDGFEIRRVVLYVAEPVASLSPVTAAALKSRDIDIVLFYSPRTAETFARLVREAGLASALSRTVALGLSPAVLKAVADLPWAMTEAARQPQETDLIRAIARHKIIAQLEGKPVEEETPEIVFGRRADDSAARAEEPPRPAPAAMAPRGARGVAIVAWLAVLLALGTFALVLLQQDRPGSALAPATVLRLETRLGALERQIANLPTPPAADPEAETRVKALEARLAAVESRPAPAAAASAPDMELFGRIEALEKKLADFAGAPPPPSPAVPQDFADRVTALEQALDARPDVGQIAAALADNRRMAGEIARLQEQIASLGAVASRSGAREGLLLAIGQLREAARQGRPFAAELATVQGLAGDEPALTTPAAALQPLATRAIPTRDSLRARFDAVARDAARASADAALGGDTASDDLLGQWWNGVVRRLSSMVSVRRVGETTGDSPQARLARAEQAVAAGDLAAAAAALEGFTGPGGDIVAAWVAEVRARLEVDRAGEALLAAALAANAAAGGTGQ